MGPNVSAHSPCIEGITISALTLVAPLVPLLVSFPLVSQLIYDWSICVPSQKQPPCWRVATPYALRVSYTRMLLNCSGLSIDAEDFAWYGWIYHSACRVIYRHRTISIHARAISFDHAILDFVRPGDGTMPPVIYSFHFCFIYKYYFFEMYFNEHNSYPKIQDLFHL